MRFLPLFAAIFAITPLAIDMYLPALPQIAESLDSPMPLIQNSISVYLAGYATGMFIFGPLADRFGRRPLLLCGLAGFIVFTGLIPVAETAADFLLLRFFQALSGAAATVVIPGAIRHLFGKDTAKGLSYVSMIMMVAPMLAPAIGGYLLLLDEWPLIFIALGVYAGFIWLLAARYFPRLERSVSTALPSKPSDTPKTISFTGRYKIVLADSVCRPYLIISMLVSLVFFTYITSVSFLYIQVFGFNAQQFSWLFGLNVAAMIVASFLNTRLVPRVGSPTLLKMTAPVALFAAASFFLWVWVDGSVIGIISSIIVMIASVMLLSANADAIILQQFGSHAGTATAVIGTLRFGIGALAGPLLAFFFDGSGLPMAGLSLLCMLLVNTCLQVALWRVKSLPIA